MNSSKKLVKGQQNTTMRETKGKWDTKVHTDRQVFVRGVENEIYDRCIRSDTKNLAEIIFITNIKSEKSKRVTEYDIVFN